MGSTNHFWDFAPSSTDRFFLVVNVGVSFTVTVIVWTKTAFAVTLLRLPMSEYATLER